SADREGGCRRYGEILITVAVATALPDGIRDAGFCRGRFASAPSKGGRMRMATLRAFVLGLAVSGLGVTPALAKGGGGGGGGGGGAGAPGGGNGAGPAADGGPGTGHGGGDGAAAGSGITTG